MIFVIEMVTLTNFCVIVYVAPPEKYCLFAFPIFSHKHLEDLHLKNTHTHKSLSLSKCTKTTCKLEIEI